MENWPNDSAGCDVLTNTNAGQTHSRMCQCSMTDVMDGFSLSTEAYKACMAMQWPQKVFETLSTLKMFEIVMH